MMNNAEEIEYTIEMMRKHEDKAILVEQLQAMLNGARQRLRQQQYEDYFNSHK